MEEHSVGGDMQMMRIMMEVGMKDSTEGNKEMEEKCCLRKMNAGLSRC
jgi:hypothetical protein